MPFDFDRVPDRRGTHSEKWDSMEAHYGVSPEDGIPLWVADMEFLPPPAVREALRAEVEQGVHGYFGDPEEWHGAVCRWMERRHGWRVEPEWISFSHGIVVAVNLLVQAFCRPGDEVVLQVPVYYPFFGAVRDNGCRVVANRLVERGGRYEMDLEALARQCGERTRMLILCSPHNPGGRVWSREELSRLAEFCLSRDILLVSDEIHHDLVYTPGAHTVLATLAPEVEDAVVTCTSASKTFNLAGTMCGNVIIKNPSLRRRFRSQAARCGMYLPNRFGPIAAAAAYRHGDAWLDALLAYLAGNRDLVCRTVEDSLPGVRCMRPEGTYLAWLDTSGTGLSAAEVHRRVEREARLALSHGEPFGPGGGGWLRLNFACPRAMLDEALARLCRCLGGAGA